MGEGEGEEFESGVHFSRNSIVEKETSINKLFMKYIAQVRNHPGTLLVRGLSRSFVIRPTYWMV